MAMTARQFLASFGDRQKNLPGAHRCVSCNVPLQETITGCRHTSEGYKCSDCYFDALSAEFDSHPVFMPRSVRGA